MDENAKFVSMQFVANWNDYLFEPFGAMGTMNYNAMVFIGRILCMLET